MPTAVLSRHALLIGAIFIPYMGLMITLAVFIWRTGYPRDRSGDREDDGDREPDLPVPTRIGKQPIAPAACTRLSLRYVPDEAAGGVWPALVARR